MDYISAKDAAHKWGITQRRVAVLCSENRNYILVGPGRWGSSDEWLGIPVKWPQISNARLIVETSFSNYRIDPSQGTHFFQNLTSFGVSYFTINPHINDGSFDDGFLKEQPAVYCFQNWVLNTRYINAFFAKI